MSIASPNYTQTPNAVFALMPQMGNAELRVVLAICRKTFGWHKTHDKLSLSQIEELTGLSRQGAYNGIDAAITRGIITREPSGNSFVYSVNVEDDAEEQSTGLTNNSLPSRPKSVYVVDTQKKKENKTKKHRAKPRDGKASPPKNQPIVEIADTIDNSEITDEVNNFLGALSIADNQSIQSPQPAIVPSVEVVEFDDLIPALSDAEAAELDARRNSRAEYAPAVATQNDARREFGEQVAPEIARAYGLEPDAKIARSVAYRIFDGDKHAHNPDDVVRAIRAIPKRDLGNTPYYLVSKISVSVGKRKKILRFANV